MGKKITKTNILDINHETGTITSCQYWLSVSHSSGCQHPQHTRPPSSRRRQIFLVRSRRRCSKGSILLSVDNIPDPVLRPPHKCRDQMDSGPQVRPILRLPARKRTLLHIHSASAL